MTNNYDAIIIGGGHNGLVAAHKSHSHICRNRIMNQAQM